MTTDVAMTVARLARIGSSERDGDPRQYNRDPPRFSPHREKALVGVVFLLTTLILGVCVARVLETEFPPKEADPVFVVLVVLVALVAGVISTWVHRS